MMKPKHLVRLAFIVGLFAGVSFQQGQAKPRPKEAFKVPDSVEVRLDLPYADTEDPRQRLDLYLPKARAQDKPLPVLVFIHGGAWLGGTKSMGESLVCPYVASGQYAGASVEYRFSDQAKWPAQIQDCKAAIRWIRGQAQALGLDPTRIGVWGASAGGHLVSVLGTSGGVSELEGDLGAFLDQDSRVACVVNYFGPENFLSMPNQASDLDRKAPDCPEARLLGCGLLDCPDRAQAASPITYVSPDDPPFLTVHGDQDKIVPFAQAEEIHAALTQAKVPSILIRMEGAGHGFQNPEVSARVRRFLDLHLLGIAGDVSGDSIPCR